MKETHLHFYLPEMDWKWSKEGHEFYANLVAEVLRDSVLKRNPMNLASYIKSIEYETHGRQPNSDLLLQTKRKADLRNVRFGSLADLNADLPFGPLCGLKRTLLLRLSTDHPKTVVERQGL